MKVIAINGSPRKKWNTATLLEHALEGAESKGAETELIHLYDLDYKGCNSCFACKLKDGKSYGKCAVNDGLTTALDRIAEADALILGSPVYFGTVTGEMRSFMERLLFQYLIYTSPPSSLFPKNIRTAFIYTMNISEQGAQEMGFTNHFAANENVLRRVFGEAETLCSYQTLLFEDYDRIVYDFSDPEVHKERRRTVFPEDCKRAFELGVRMANTAGTS